MQLLRILLALTLLIAPLGARGQEPTLPVSLEKPCSVPADRSWTPQEKFVWERVCVGEDADFNEAAGYGGQLDPTKPEGWAQNRVLRPKFLQTILFKDPYRSATAAPLPLPRGSIGECLNGIFWWVGSLVSNSIARYCGFASSSFIRSSLLRSSIKSPVRFLPLF